MTRDTTTRARTVFTLIGMILTLTLVAAACGDSDSSSSGSAEDFCDLATELENSDPFGDDVGFDSFNKDFFDRIDDVFSRVSSAAPSAIKADTETMRDGFREFADLLDEYDYNLFDPDLGTAMENLDTAELDAASERVNTYVEDECGIDLSDGDDSTSGLTDDPAVQDLAEDFSQLGDDPAAIAGFIDAFGIDEELAECLSEELGNIDLDNPDASILSKEVCGTTLFELITSLNLGN